jgi:hypothetical protein
MLMATDHELRDAALVSGAGTRIGAKLAPTKPDEIH